jgi:hypothetical protein
MRPYQIPVPKNDAGVEPGVYEWRLAIRYYNLDTLASSDTYMKRCIDMKGGDWQAVGKDSDEYREAVRARARREVENLRKTIGEGP